MRTSAWERTAMFVLLAGPLIPSLEAGTTPLELAGFAGPVLAGLYLAFAPGHRLRPGDGYWFLPLLALVALVALLHESPSYFLSFSMGIPIFCLAAYLGATAPSDREDVFLLLIAVHLFAGCVLEIFLDTQGWVQADSGARAEAWELGKRGVNAARSTKGVHLAAWAGWALLGQPQSGRRLFGFVALPLAFYHIVVFGQGRGATLTAAAALALLVFQARRISWPMLVLAVPALVALQSGALDLYLDPLRDRFAAQSVDAIDRIAHARVGMRLVEQMDLEQALTGISHGRVELANGGETIHNAYLDIAVNYGIPAAIAFCLVVASILVATVRDLSQRPPINHPIGTSVAFVWLLATLTGGMFWDWRRCVVPGILIGFGFRTRTLQGQP